MICALYAAELGCADCSLAQCPAWVTFVFIDRSGDARDIHGKVSFGGTELAFRCPAPAMTSTTAPAAGVVCTSDGVRIEGVAAEMQPLLLDVQDAAGHRFHGTVGPTYSSEHDFAGSCRDCVSGRATVELE